MTSLEKSHFIQYYSNIKEEVFSQIINIPTPLPSKEIFQMEDVLYPSFNQQKETIQISRITEQGTKNSIESSYIISKKTLELLKKYSDNEQQNILKTFKSSM